MYRSLKLQETVAETVKINYKRFDKPLNGHAENPWKMQLNKKGRYRKIAALLYSILKSCRSFLGT